MEFYLPHFKGDKRNQVTGKNPIDFMKLGHDTLTEHARVFVFALSVHRKLATADKIIFSLNDAAVGIQTISLLVNIIAHYIQARPDRNRNIGTVSKKFD